ncbi:hypothetical protein KRMM14A1004_56490 [Krasilnikovia sp. MM14-A1004]
MTEEPNPDISDGDRLSTFRTSEPTGARSARRSSVADLEYFLNDVEQEGIEDGDILKPVSSEQIERAERAVLPGHWLLDVGPVAWGIRRMARRMRKDAIDASLGTQPGVSTSQPSTEHSTTTTAESGATDQGSGVISDEIVNQPSRAFPIIGILFACGAIGGIFIGISKLGSQRAIVLTVGALVLGFVVAEIVAAILPLIIVMKLVPPEDRNNLASLLAAADRSNRWSIWPSLFLAARNRRSLNYSGAIRGRTDDRSDAGSPGTNDQSST